MTAPYPFVDWQEPLEELCTQEDWVQHTLNRMGNGGEIGSLNTHLQERMYYQQLLRMQQEKCT